MTTITPRAVYGLALVPVAPLAGDRDVLREWLDGWWYAAHVAGMAHGLDDLPALRPEVSPDELTWLSLLAGRRAADGASTAIEFRAHDVLGVLLQWDVHDDASLQAALAALPDAALEPPASALGEARLVVATAPSPVDLDPTMVTGALGIGGTGLEFSAVLDGQALLTELESGTRRTFTLVVPDADPGLGARLLDVGPGPVMGTLTRYVIHGAKLRYLTGVFQAEQPRVRTAGQRSDESLSALFRLHESLEGATGRLDRTFFDANSRLGRAQGDAAGLAVMSSWLQDLARSTNIAARNLASFAPGDVRPARSGEPTTFDRDAELAEWLQESVEEEVGYLDSAKTRAAEAHQLTQLRLEQASEEEARLSNRLTTLQTSVLGAVLGFLGVMEAFSESFQGHPELFWPVFLTVPTLALLVPPLTLRWVTGLTTADVVAGAVCGLTSGWTITTIAELPSGVGAAASGALGGAAAAVVALHRRRQHVGVQGIPG